MRREDMSGTHNNYGAYNITTVPSNGKCPAPGAASPRKANAAVDCCEAAAPVVLRGRGTQQAPLALQLFWADCGQEDAPDASTGAGLPATGAGAGEDCTRRTQSAVSLFTQAWHLSCARLGPPASATAISPSRPILDAIVVIVPP